MCSAPVTFGGGIATEKFSSGVPSAVGMEVAALDPFGEDPPLDLGRVVAGLLLKVLQSRSRSSARRV